MFSRRSLLALASNWVVTPLHFWNWAMTWPASRRKSELLLVSGTWSRILPLFRKL